MNYQEMEDQVNQNASDIADLQQLVDDANLVGGIEGLTFPLDPDVATILDEETISFFSDRIGSATLVAGTVTVTNPYVTTNSTIIISRKTSSGTLGYLSISTQSSGSFTIISSSATDTSVVNYLIF